MRFSTLHPRQIQPAKHHLQPVTTAQLGVDCVFFEEAGLCIKNPRLLMKGEKDGLIPRLLQPMGEGTQVQNFCLRTASRCTGKKCKKGCEGWKDLIFWSLVLRLLCSAWRSTL